MPTTSGKLNASFSASTRPWHAQPQETVFSELGAGTSGLDTDEAARRMERYGPNRLPEAPPRGPLMRLLAQFHNLLIYVLLGAALIAGAMGHWVDTFVILGVVLVNAVIGFVQEGKADDWRVHGDPMEGALVVLAVKAALEPEEERRQHPRADLIPFESEHKFMAMLHHAHDDRAIIYLKGAPEQVLVRCVRVQGAAGEELPMDAERWRQRVEDLANQGQRVLAVACKPARDEQRELDLNDVEEDMVLLGLIDPPRGEAIEAVAECRTAGIRVKMITGDHAGTARAIAAKLKLKNSAEAITGHGLDQMDDAALTERVRDVDVYARVSPEHKLRLVMLLQAQGAIVAMTGGRPTRGIGMKPRFELRWLSVVVLPPANIGPVAASPHGAQVSGAGS